MTITKFPNGASSFGMPLVGMTTGSVFFVDSVTGSNGNSGTDSSSPLATIDYAVSKCTANKGDVIFVMPGHTETVTAAAGLDLDVAGISVIGLGNGSNRPMISLTTATTADVDVDAANITLKNIQIDMTGVDAVAAGIDVNAARFTMEDCEVTLSDTAGQAVIGVTMDGAADHCTFKNCRFLVLGACGPDAAIKASASEIEGLTIQGCYFGGVDGDIETFIQATVAGSSWLITDNHFEVGLAGKLPMNLGLSDADNSGIIARNMVVVGDTAALTSLAAAASNGAGNLGCLENYAVVLGSGASGVMWPETAEAYPA